MSPSVWRTKQLPSNARQRFDQGLVVLFFEGVTDTVRIGVAEPVTFVLTSSSLAAASQENDVIFPMTLGISGKILIGNLGQIVDEVVV